MNRMNSVNLLTILRKRELIQRYRIVAAALLIGIGICALGYYVTNYSDDVPAYLYLSVLASIIWCTAELIIYSPRKKNVLLLKNYLDCGDLIVDLTTAQGSGLVFGKSAFAVYRSSKTGRLIDTVILPYTSVKWIYKSGSNRVKVYRSGKVHFSLRMNGQEADYLIQNHLLAATPDLIVGNGKEQRAAFYRRFKGGI